MTHLYILSILCFIVAASAWLVRRTRLRVVGSALLVVVLAAVAANLGALPTASAGAEPVAVYEGLLSYGAPLAVFWLLLPVRLRDTLPASRPLLVLFLIGAVATAGGVMLGLWAVDGVAALGPRYDAVGGLFVAAYTGGNVHFDAVAGASGIASGGALHESAVVVDHAVVVLWLMITLVLPRLLLPIWPRKAFTGARPVVSGGVVEDETVRPVHLALALAMGLGAVWLAEYAAAQLAAWSVPVPSLLVLIVLALVLAQFRPVARLQGVHTLGTFAVYLFLAVLGAYLDVTALVGLEERGIALLLLALVVLAVHGVVIFAAARWMKADPVLAAVASQAGIGNPVSALALARGLGRPDLRLPAVVAGLIGLLGGVYLGRWTVAYLMPLLGSGF